MGQTPFTVSTQAKKADVNKDKAAYYSKRTAELEKIIKDLMPLLDEDYANCCIGPDYRKAIEAAKDALNPKRKV